MYAKLLQSCLTLCNSMDCSLPGSSAHGILQAKTLEWVAISFSRGFSWPRVWTRVSCIAGVFFTAEPPEKQLCIMTYNKLHIFKQFAVLTYICTHTHTHTHTRETITTIEIMNIYYRHLPAQVSLSIYLSCFLAFTGNHWAASYHYRLVCLFYNFFYKWNHIVCTLLSGFFQLG